MLPTDITSPQYLAARNAAMSRVDLSALDAGDPTGPCGHDYGLRVSTRLTTDYRTTEESEPVVRFYDPAEVDLSGSRIPVIDLMVPGSMFQETILKEHVLTDIKTGSKYPTPEAAIVAKYAAMISPKRRFARKQQDGADLGRLICSVHPNFNVLKIQSLAGQVWEGGSEEILRFIDCALNEKPFPV